MGLFQFILPNRHVILDLDKVDRTGCDKGYGVVLDFDLSGKLLNKYDAARDGGNGESKIFETLCDFVAGVKELENKAKKPQGG